MFTFQDSHFYTVLTNWDKFDVKEGNQLWAMGTQGIDFETQRAVRVEVRSTDSGTPPLYVSREFVFSIEDVNEAPSDIILTNNEVTFGIFAYNSLNVLFRMMRYDMTFTQTDHTISRSEILHICRR